MARVLAGPLAASISGAVGDVVVRATRFGLVAQKKHWPTTFTTASALLTKGLFRDAMVTFGGIHGVLKTRLGLYAATSSQASSQAWCSAFKRWRQGSNWHCTAHWQETQALTFVSATLVGNVLTFVTDLNNLTPVWSCHLLIIRNGRFPPGGNNLPLLSLALPTTSVIPQDIAVGDAIIAFPIPQDNAFAIGYSDLIVVS